MASKIDLFDHRSASHATYFSTHLHKVHWCSEHTNTQSEVGQQPLSATSFAAPQHSADPSISIPYTTPSKEHHQAHDIAKNTTQALARLELRSNLRMHTVKPSNHQYRRGNKDSDQGGRRTGVQTLMGERRTNNHSSCIAARQFIPSM